VRSRVFEEYASIVLTHCQRELTEPEDALRDIDGIMAVLAIVFSTEMLYGISESVLGFALLWQAKEPLSRRCEIAYIVGLGLDRMAG
jgi:hypothetical protein